MSWLAVEKSKHKRDSKWQEETQNNMKTDIPKIAKENVIYKIYLYPYILSLKAERTGKRLFGGWSGDVRWFGVKLPKNVESHLFFVP